MEFIQHVSTVQLEFNEKWNPFLVNSTTSNVSFDDLSNPRYSILGFAIFVLFLIWHNSPKLQNPSGLPVVGRKWYELGYRNARDRFLTGAPHVIKDSIKKHGDAFYLYTDSKFNLILNYKYADAIRNDNRLSFMKAIQHKFRTSSGIHGFEPHMQACSDRRFVREVVIQVLTRSLSTFTEPINSECDYALRQNWTDKTETHEVMLKETMWKIVGQILSRIYFNEEEIYRNPEWIRLSADYIKMSTVAAHELRSWPKSVRKIAAKFNPRCKLIQNRLESLRELTKPLVTKLNSQKPAENPASPVEWLNKAFHDESPDLVSMIIAICFVSYDAGTEALTEILTDISGKDQLIRDLRSEIIEVIGKEGFSRTALQNLHLMDSVMKESQRLHPESYVPVQRLAMEDVTLPDGIVIPKDTVVMISGVHMMMDSSVWPDGQKFDGYRFYNLRQKANKASQSSFNYVSTSPEHMGFGHGNQACSGRFFAGYLIKIVLCHILMKYDFSVKVPAEGAQLDRAYTVVAHPELRINLTRRTPEIPLEVAGSKA